MSTWFVYFNNRVTKERLICSTELFRCGWAKKRKWQFTERSCWNRLQL